MVMNFCEVVVGSPLANAFAQSTPARMTADLSGWESSSYPTVEWKSLWSGKWELQTVFIQLSFSSYRYFLVLFSFVVGSLVLFQFL